MPQIRESLGEKAADAKAQSSPRPTLANSNHLLAPRGRTFDGGAVDSLDPTAQARLLQDLQRTGGNRAVQGLIGLNAGGAPRGRLRRFDASSFLEPKTKPVPDDELRSRVDKTRRDGPPGSALPAGERARMEQSVDTNLEGVRVHEGESALPVTDSLGAAGAAIGSDIFLSPRLPGSERDRVLRHEVAHVVQTGGRVGSGPVIGEPDSAHERDAERVAEGIGSGERVTSQAPSAAAPMVQPYRTFPISAADRVLDLDPTPITDWCRTIANAGLELWDGTGFQGLIEGVFRGPHFLQRGVSSWGPSEHVRVETGFWDPDYIIWIDNISLFQDDTPTETGAGTTATLGSQGTSSSTHAGSVGRTSTRSVSGSLGNPKETGVTVGGSGEQRDTREGGGAVGGQVSSSSQSATRRFETNIYASVRMSFQPTSWLQSFPTRSYQSLEYQVGHGTYTLPTLQAPADTTPRP